MKVVKTANKSWENRHEVFVEDINDMYIPGNESALDALDSYNDATKGLQQLIADAIANNTPLRALGAGWSWPKIATVKNGVMLDTKQLNTVFTISAQSVSPACAIEPRKLLFAQSGNCIWELERFLFNKGMSLRTSGASNGQTIAGAMSTCTHGSAFDFGSVPDFVVGLHIVSGANKHVWLERASAPIASQQFIDNLQTELISDDDLFNAALVSFGSFGIIHGVMIETEDLFLLESSMERIPYDDGLKHIMDTLDFSQATGLPNGTERPFHFSVLVNPHDIDGGAYVTTMYKRPYTTSYSKPVSNTAGIGPGDDAPSFIGLLSGMAPIITPLMVNKVLAASLNIHSKQIGTLAEIFSNTTLRGKLLSAAIAIPLAETSRVADILIEINKDGNPFAGLFSFRFVKGTKATLGFIKFPQTCVFELDAAFSNDTHLFYERVWTRLEAENIPFTFHWGKVGELNPERLDYMYGDSIDKWLQARQQLLDADTRKIFNNALLQQWGMDA
ncbi:FAD-binding protein [Mucilaginibacter sp. JRF]|uniref:FAD-binding protein n=1 Tax=Mucilaginibacter sp. JRF TaxID=2780088 RepID=UPI001881F69E|nr:FAD-binding protein [Mucilaginibacter sp. JRF]MBE9585848.1 FAD-binding protein [Mucilaginibacter sp. JRF]